MSFQAEAVLKQLGAMLPEEGPSLVKTLKASYQFNIKKGSVSKTWTLDLKKGSGSLIEGKGAKKADCILTLKDGDFMDLLSGKKKAPQLFMKGKLKLKGNMGKAMKFDKVLKKLRPKAKL